MTSVENEERFTMVRLPRRTAALGFDLIDAFAQQTSGQAVIHRPVGDVFFHVIARGPLDPAAGLVDLIPVPLELDVIRNRSGIYVATGTVFHRPQLHRFQLAPARYIVEITSDNYQPLRTEVFSYPAPTAAEALQRHELQPGYAYTFGKSSRSTVFRGILRTVDGKGIVSARLETEYDSAASIDHDGQSWESDYVTDNTGRWLFAVPNDLFPGNQPSTIELTVRVTLPDATSFDLVQTLIRGKDARVAETVLRGRVESSGGMGLGGAEISVTGVTGRSKSNTNGEWRFYFPLHPAASSPAVLAVTSGGQLQVRVVEFTPGSTTDVKPIVFG